jgi:biopolymer transport protein ExbB
VANVVKSALLKFDEPTDELEKALENAAINEVRRLEKFLPVLAGVSNTAPLFGFLGTVTGMINSFDQIAKAGLSNPGAVAAGISEALITTAAGLIVALGSQPLYNYYSSVVTKFLREMEAASHVLLETHMEMNKRS